MQILDVKIQAGDVFYSGDEVSVLAKIKLGTVAATDIIVEVYYGLLNASNEIQSPHRIRMHKDHQEGEVTIFTTKISCDYGGRYGHVVRILPGHPHLAVEFIPELIKWET
jgi:hypothetical protein